MLSIIFSILALILLKGIPESKDESAHNKKFDIIGIIIFVIMMLSINIVITQGDRIGWLNPIIVNINCHIHCDINSFLYI